MNKLFNAVMIFIFMTAKIQGVQAQGVELDKKITKTETENISDPMVLAQYIAVNPYDYSHQRKIDEVKETYLEKLDAEKTAKKEAKDKKKAEEAAKKKKIVAAVKIDTRTNFAELYEKAGKMFGIHPKLLQAVHIVETGGSGSTARRSYAGAQGPMQFLPSTFRAYAVDGNGDGTKDINNVEDAVFSAAHYLARNQGATNVRRALWHYNHSNTYIEKVLGIAKSLGF